MFTKEELLKMLDWYEWVLIYQKPMPKTHEQLANKIRRKIEVLKYE